MMRWNRITPALLAVIWIGCGADVPAHREFVVGMSRMEISSRFGKPDSTQVLTKTDDGIWGPIESFWLEVPTGAKVEIWAFRSTMDGQRGQTELYFVDDGDSVDGIGFHVESAVYEGS